MGLLCIAQTNGLSILRQCGSLLFRLVGTMYRASCSQIVHKYMYIHLILSSNFKCLFMFVFKLLANIVIYICAITVGVTSYYMADRKHRKAFLEARQSLEVKLNLEEQSQQQVRRPIDPLHLEILHMGTMLEGKKTVAFHANHSHAAAVQNETEDVGIIN